MPRTPDIVSSDLPSVIFKDRSQTSIQGSVPEGYVSPDARNRGTTVFEWSEGCPFWPKPNPEEPCEPAWTIRACKCAAKSTEVRCNRLACPECGKREGVLEQRRAEAIRERFEAGRGPRATLYTVFTVPPNLRDLASDPKVWSRWRRAIWKYLKKICGGDFAVERTDPEGDKSPGVWHPHLNFLWIQKNGFRPFIDVDALRTAWQEILGAPVADCWHHYEPGISEQSKNAIGHWYSYMARAWCAWRNSVPRHLNVRWLGSYPKKKPKESCNICPRCLWEFQITTVTDRELARELASTVPMEAWKWIANHNATEKAMRRRRYKRSTVEV